MHHRGSGLPLGHGPADMSGQSPPLVAAPPGAGTSFVVGRGRRLLEHVHGLVGAPDEALPFATAGDEFA